MDTAKITRWMKQNATAYNDGYGSINMTELAEAAADAFNLHGPAPRYDIPEKVFEIAFDVSEWYEASYGKDR